MARLRKFAKPQGTRFGDKIKLATLFPENLFEYICKHAEKNDFPTFSDAAADLIKCGQLCIEENDIHERATQVECALSFSS